CLSFVYRKAINIFLVHLVSSHTTEVVYHYLVIQRIWFIDFNLDFIYFLPSTPPGFCLEDLSIGESGVLKSPTIIVWGLMCYLTLVIFILQMCS
ncbi:hypothetical protein STEG23_000833, partial [Scotinomys teguina]